MLHLKQAVVRNKARVYYSGSDICYDDLEKKNRAGSLLIAGRNLYNLAVRRSKEYKKALAYSSNKQVDKKWKQKSQDRVLSMRLSM